VGREVRRTHKDFDVPLGKTWWGFTLPPLSCQDCSGCGDVNDVTCPTCEGDGQVFPKIEPPSYELSKFPDYMERIFGEEYGWQMWETTSEGSPISPVCASPEELARWLTDNGASTFASMTADYEQWLNMIKGPGSAPSMVISPEKGIQSGVIGLTD